MIVNFTGVILPLVIFTPGERYDENFFLKKAFVLSDWICIDRQFNIYWWINRVDPIDSIGLILIIQGSMLSIFCEYGLDCGLYKNPIPFNSTTNLINVPIISD